jgi:hypothetical protein
VSSQDEAVITISNTGSTDCTVAGYPRIRAMGAAGRLRIRVKRGDTYFVTDPGSRLIRLRPHGTASFSIATTLGYSHPQVITALRLTLPQWPHTRSLRVPCHSGISAPIGRPAPVWETALAAV